MMDVDNDEDENPLPPAKDAGKRLVLVNEALQVARQLEH